MSCLEKSRSPFVSFDATCLIGRGCIVSFIRAEWTTSKMSSSSQPLLKCVSSTGATFCRSIRECNDSQPPAKRRRVGRNGDYSNLFREAQFSGDGTTIVTHSEDETLRTFVLPPDLLDGGHKASVLQAYSEIQSPTNTLSYVLYPHFDLQHPSTTLALIASRDVPLALRNTLHYDTLHGSYPLIDAATEKFETPHSLVWTADGTHFVAGSKDQVAVFDASYDGSGPTSLHKTAPGRNARKRYGVQGINSCKGLISALRISPDGLLAAGTLGRHIGLFDHSGFGECSTSFSLDASLDESGKRSGTGVTHLRWSPCGKYVLVAERQSDVVHVYDVRSTHRRVGWLSGRHADTTQKLGIDVVSTVEGFEVWGGGTDGCVRMWENAGSKEGEQKPDQKIKLHEGTRPGATILILCADNAIFRSYLERSVASRRSSPCYLLRSQNSSSISLRGRL